MLPHNALQDHLYGRYFLPPSLLYSVVRLLPNKQAYEVPVDADWVTIAVVAQRSEVKVSARSTIAGIPQVVGDDDGRTDGESDGDIGVATDHEAENNFNAPSTEPRKQGKPKPKRSKKKERVQAAPRSRKFVTLKLVDFGCRSSSSSSTPGGVRGDALMNLVIFEADSVGYEYEQGKDNVRRHRACSQIRTSSQRPLTLSVEHLYPVVMGW